MDNPKDQSEKNRICFGYLYQTKNNFEQILVRVNELNEWTFPILFECNSTESVKPALYEQVTKTLGIDNIFNGNLNTPEIIEIEFFDPDYSSKYNSRYTECFFVKIECQASIILEISEYRWFKKKDLFEDAVTGILTSIETRPLLQLLNSDDIRRKYERNYLKCADLIVFREKPRLHKTSLQPDDIQFLMLQRGDSLKGEENWEYPKGGLYYHENLNEGAIRELLEETGSDSIGDFKYCGYLGYQNVDVSNRNREYDALEVHGITYYFCGNSGQIHKHVLNNRKEKKGEHIAFSWMTLQEAKDVVWMRENNYAKIFFKNWQDMSKQILKKSYRPTSIAFQITEICGHSCLYCHRRKVNKKELDNDRIFDIIDILSERGVRKITITGGEPLAIGKERVFEILKYIHEKEIHTTLSSTCMFGNHIINEGDFRYLNDFLDHLMISINCFDHQIAKRTYKDIRNWEDRLKLALNIINIISDLDIILEVCTVVTKSSFTHIEEIGRKLFEMNPKILWRVDEFYQIGDNCKNPEEFELEEGEFEKVSNVILNGSLKKYSHHIKFNYRKSRYIAPDYMITSQGSIVTTSKNRYEVISVNPEILNILNFRNRRPWSDYKKYCREWDWVTYYD